jgi:hypothetical protein
VANAQFDALRRRLLRVGVLSGNLGTSQKGNTLQSINLNNEFNRRRQKNRVKPKQPVLRMKTAAREKDKEI